MFFDTCPESESDWYARPVDPSRVCLCLLHQNQSGIGAFIGGRWAWLVAPDQTEIMDYLGRLSLRGDPVMGPAA